MKWVQATTLEELKACGSFNEVRQQVKDSLGNKLSLKARSWKDLLSAMQTLRNLAIKSFKQPSQEAVKSEKLDVDYLYFQSHTARIIYALLRLDGEQRLRELGIDKSYTKDLEKAKNWRNSVAKIIHPDICKHPEATEAYAKLTKLYEQMTGK